MIPPPNKSVGLETFSVLSSFTLIPGATVISSSRSCCAGASVPFAYPVLMLITGWKLITGVALSVELFEAEAIGSSFGIADE